LFETKDQIENIVFQALSHPIRRTILKIIASRPAGVPYTELIMELTLSTGKLNYHLEQLGGLIGKNNVHHYVLTPFGKKALNQLNLITQDLSPEDEKYIRIAEAAQKSSLQPALKSFLAVNIVASSTMVLVLIYVAYMAITEGAPIIVYLLLPILIAVGLGLTASFILALKKTPDWIKRFERRFFGP
jgi:DNA-binding transcriptional ArsR family regulator